MLDGLVHLLPNNNTLYCIIHGDNVLVFPIDNHHVPKQEKKKRKRKINNYLNKFWNL